MRGSLWVFSSGLALLLSGCYSYPYYGNPYQYGPGTMYGSPGQYPGGGYVAPGGTYVPSNTNGVTPTPASPGTGSGVNPPPTFRPDGGNAPAYPNNGVEKPVPKPDGFGADPNTINRTPTDDGFNTPFEQGAANPSRTTTVAAGPLPGNPDAVPMQPVAQVRGEVVDGIEYGFDQQNYAWLQGVLSYDEIDKAWSILYDVTPQDRFGGDLTLINDSRLSGLPNDTPVQIKGFLDQQMLDERGKPMYRIIEIVPLRR